MYIAWFTSGEKMTNNRGDNVLENSIIRGKL